MIWRAQGYRRRSHTWPSAKIGIVSLGLNNPIVPTDISKRNVQSFSAAIIEFRRTVDISFFSSMGNKLFFLRVSVNNYEWFVGICNRDWRFTWCPFTSFANYVDLLDLRFIVLYPFFSNCWNVYFSPIIWKKGKLYSEFTWNNFHLNLFEFGTIRIDTSNNNWSNPSKRFWLRNNSILIPLFVTLISIWQ